MNISLLEDIKQYVNHLLLPLDGMYYHHYEHALSVMERALYLGKKEGLSEDNRELLAIAGLFHDTGFVIQYDNNEILGAKIAANYLQTILYPKEKIEMIQKIILATDPRKKPKNILEEIIKDADMDNLGRNDFMDLGQKLKQEKETIQKIKIKDPDWHHASLDLIRGHKFYTKTQSDERNEMLQKNTEKLLLALKKYTH